MSPTSKRIRISIRIENHANESAGISTHSESSHYGAQSRRTFPVRRVAECLDNILFSELSTTIFLWQSGDIYILKSKDTDLLDLAVRSWANINGTR
jgi:hypothetical protein